ncbi:MAG: GDP-mannose 4,6-dehydratase [Ferruginibacter sp.]
MKILITGISGFVARHFIELLSTSGETHTVAGIYCSNQPGFSETQYPGITCSFYQVNLLNTEKVNGLLLSFRPDYILHLASKSSVAESWLHPADFITENTGIFLSLIEGLRINSLKCRMLSIGSSEEYGNADATSDALTESLCPHPASPYGAARVMQEKLVEIYSKNYGIDILHTRSFNHIGPYQSDHFVISSFAKQVVDQIKKGAKEIELVVGDVSVIRDFTDVRDVVKAYYGLMIDGKTGETYNVCSNEGYVLKDIIDMLGKLTGTTITYKTDKKNFRPSENKKIIGSFKKIKNEIGWQPEIPMEKSLRDLLAYWQTKLT